MSICASGRGFTVFDKNYVYYLFYFIFLHLNQKAYCENFQEMFEEATLLTAFLTYLSYFVLSLVGYIRDTMRSLGFTKDVAARESSKLKVHVHLDSSV